MNNLKKLPEDTVLEIESFEDFIVSEQTVNDSWNKIREHEKQNPGIYISDDIWEKFQGKTISGNKKPFKSIMYRLQTELSNGEILKEAENGGFKKIYSWIEAKKIIEKAVLRDRIKYPYESIFVFFQIEEDENLYVLVASRHSSGHIEIRSQERELEDGFWLQYSATCF